MSENPYHVAILSIMRAERESYWITSRGKFTHRMPTFLITMQFNRENTLQITGPEMFKAMKELCAQGHVIKHPDSRIGQAYWQLTDKEGS